MDEDLLAYLTRQSVATNIGPDAREAFIHQAEEEYLNGNIMRSIYFQVHSMYQTSHEHYFKSREKRKSDVSDLMAAMNSEEITEFSDNHLMQYVSKELKKMSADKSKKNECNSLEELQAETECNFLKGISSDDPLKGIHKIEAICKEMPKEWTILQLSKGPCAKATYSIFPKLHESDAAIYLTIFKHGRSDKYPTPICMRFSGNDQQKLFEDFASIVNRFKKVVSVDPKEWQTTEQKKLYWSLIKEVSVFILNACEDLKKFFFPWNFLFTGTSSAKNCQCWHKVDDFCDSLIWDDQSRVLLSLAATNVNNLNSLEIFAICEVLTNNEDERDLAVNFLTALQRKLNENACEHYLANRYPCILVIDERLDHFYWEEINVQQEFSRVSSLQCLWRLYNLYKDQIKLGYFNVNVTNGGCVINPDKNLDKMELRMGKFFDYWLPHWKRLSGQRPQEDELIKDFFVRSCYVYSGHGSGLHYVNGRHIAKMKIESVVFLFGCDSSRLHSNGLYSELIGSHLYYHAAKCPALVGTLMPGLDSHMDTVATEILSRWIAPKCPNILPWNEIDKTVWIKGASIISKAGGLLPTASLTMANSSNYHSGSLCGILARIHQRIVVSEIYNTVPYVCRGLPVWNCDVEPLPTQ